MHIEARHAQIEKQVKGIVEDALLTQGIDAYRYVEGGGGADAHGGKGAPATAGKGAAKAEGLDAYRYTEG